MSKQTNNKHREEDLRISKMISEGGLGVQAYYYSDRVMNEKSLDEEIIAAKAMVDEGGLGAELYYNEEEKIAEIDVDNEEDGFIN